MADSREHRNVRVLMGLVTLAGVATLVVGALFNERFLTRFADHPHINPINLRYIHRIQIGYLVLGGLLVLAGLLLPRLAGLRDGLARRPRALNLSLLGLVVLWPLVILELALWAHPTLSTTEMLSRSISYLPCVYGVHRMAPDQTVLGLDLLDQRPIYFIRNGYRSRPFAIPKPAGEVRIFVIGGSHVFDTGNPGASDWPTGIEDRLHRMGFANVRVINAGTPGHRCFDAVARVIGEIHLYQPDYVALCCTYNDIKYFDWVAPDHTLLRGLEPFTRPTHRPVGLVRRVLERSQIFVRLSNVVGRLAGRARPKMAGDQDVVPPSHDREAITPWALEQYRLNLRLFADACADAGIRPVFLTESRLVTQVNYARLVREGNYHTSTSLSARALADTYRQCDSLLRVVAGEKRAGFYDLARCASGVAGNFLDPIHLTPAGSATVADSAAAYFATLLREPTHGR